MGSDRAAVDLQPETSNLTSGVAYTYKIPLNDGTWITYSFGLK
jgi:hypothetical protein